MSWYISGVYFGSVCAEFWTLVPISSDKLELWCDPLDKVYRRKFFFHKCFSNVGAALLFLKFCNTCRAQKVL